MKTIVEINSINYASTGNIMLNIATQARLDGFNVYTCCKASKESYKHHYDNQMFIGNRFERILTSYLTEITGLRDHFNLIGTYLFIQKLKKINPDLVHLHVMHDDFINVRMLFNYLASNNIPVIWTFHDCSAMTGTCPAFEMVGCDKWKTMCNHCPQIHGDTNSLFFDTSSLIWKKRKRWFTSLKKLTIVTPSRWLNNVVKKSYFKNYETIVINNGIDLNIFKPNKQETKENKYNVLGVANEWNKRKGLDVFVELANKLPNNYQIILVGTNDEIDKQLPDSIESIHRTYDVNQLVDLYSSADVFVNPTREDNFPTVNIEALACGTPVVTFNTGGSPEIIDDKSGVVIEKNNVNELMKSIREICENKIFNSNGCRKRAEHFNKDDKFNEYIKLYHKILNN